MKKLLLGLALTLAFPLSAFALTSLVHPADTSKFDPITHQPVLGPDFKFSFGEMTTYINRTDVRDADKQTFANLFSKMAGNTSLYYYGYYGAGGSTIWNTTTIRPVPMPTEKMTCKFNGTTTPQKCYSVTWVLVDLPTFSCGSANNSSGIGTCVANVTGPKDAVLQWISTKCRGYGYTFIDGKDEISNFDCSTPISSAVTQNQAAAVRNVLQALINLLSGR